ncbi:MAG: hypothetical protein R6V33_09010 [Pelovirga sp.]
MVFTQHKKLTFLSAPAAKVTKLLSSSSAIQLAFSGYPPQPCRAYLLQLSGGGKALILVAFYLLETRSTVLFVPETGEVAASEADRVYEEGYQFVESMGFVLTQTDFHLLAAGEKQNYWSKLPITQPPRAVVVEQESAPVDRTEEELQLLRDKSLSSLGRYLASM